MEPPFRSFGEAVGQQVRVRDRPEHSWKVATRTGYWAHYFSFPARPQSPSWSPSWPRVSPPRRRAGFTNAHAWKYAAPLEAREEGAPTPAPLRAPPPAEATRTVRLNDQRGSLCEGCECFWLQENCHQHFCSQG